MTPKPLPSAPRIPLLVAALAAALVACQGTPERAPFEAEPPPATYVPSKKATAAPDHGDQAKVVDRGDGSKPKPEHIYGKDVYPCSGHPICQQGSPEDETLHIDGGGAPSIDPNLVTDTEGQMLALNMFEGLLKLGPSGEDLPGVAEKWERSEDGLTYTFHLRKDAKWTNGRTVTAHDFVYSWIRKIDPETASEAAETITDYVKNAKEFNAGAIKDPAEVGVKALDDFTLQVELASPVPFWLLYLNSGHYLPVPREAVEAHGKQWTRPEHIVTNGAYKLVEYKERDKVVLAKNPGYWDADSVRIPRVIMHFSESESTSWTRYDAGQLHWMRTPVPPDKVTRFLSEKRPDFYIDPLLCVYFYPFRVDKAPFDNVLVRRAVNMAIDKERLVQHVTKSMQQPARGVVPPFLARLVGYEAPKGDPFDPQKARELLAQAGYPGGAGLPKITLVYNTFEAHRLVAEFVQRSLKEHLGVEIQIDNMEWKSLLSKLNSGDFQMSRYGWCGAAEPYSFMNLFKSDSPRNSTAWKNEEFDELLDKSLQTLDHDERMGLLAKAEALIQRDMPIAPLYYYTRGYVKVPVLRGFQPELNNNHLFQYMYWGDKEYSEK